MLNEIQRHNIEKNLFNTFVFELNNEYVRNAAALLVSDLLNADGQNRYVVHCDIYNNDEYVIDAGSLVVDVYDKVENNTTRITLSYSVIKEKKLYAS